MTLGALVIWFLYSCSKTFCQFQKERRLGGQGYVLASMEEGDGGRRDSSHNRPSTPRFPRKPSLSSPRNFFHSGVGNSPPGLIQQTVSRALGAWSSRSTATRRSFSASHPSSPRPSRPSRLGSPKLPVNAGFGEGTDGDQNMLIPPVSITTSLSAPVGGTGYQSTTSTRTSLDEGLFVTVPVSRTGSSSGSKRFNDDWTKPAQLAQDGAVHADHLFPLDRPKYRFSHSKSFQSLSSPSDHHLDDLDYLPPSLHDRPLSSSPHDLQSSRPHHHHLHPQQQQQQRTLNSHSCSNLTDFSSQ